MGMFNSNMLPSMDSLQIDPNKIAQKTFVQDPFQSARSAFELQQAGAASAGNMQSMGGPGIAPQAPAMPSAPYASAQAPLASALSFSPQDRAKFEATKLPTALQQLGIDDKMLALNDIGRIQLLGRLKNKFGDSYQQNPQALDVLNIFDSHVQNNANEADALTSMISRGNRTLSSLFGGNL